MCPQYFSVRRPLFFVVVMLLSIGLATVAAQSQEPKPALPATPVGQPAGSGAAETTTGVSGSSWQSPNFGVRIHWDPAVWSVEGESIEAGYDGLQIRTPSSTVFLEAYDDFAGDAEACLAAAQQEIGEREGVSEVVPLTDRSLPVPTDVRGAAGLFGLTASLPDGTKYRGIEYIECRTVRPGEAVLEITWQAITQAFNEDFANVEELLAAIEMPEELPSATPVAPRATPVA